MRIVMNGAFALHSQCGDQFCRPCAPLWMRMWISFFEGMCTLVNANVDIVFATVVRRHVIVSSCLIYCCHIHNPHYTIKKLRGVCSYLNHKCLVTFHSFSTNYNNNYKFNKWNLVFPGNVLNTLLQETLKIKNTLWSTFKFRNILWNHICMKAYNNNVSYFICFMVFLLLLLFLWSLVFLKQL